MPGRGNLLFAGANRRSSVRSRDRRKDQLRYVAGEDAKATYAMRLQLGDEAFRKAMSAQFFGN